MKDGIDDLHCDELKSVEMKGWDRDWSIERKQEQWVEKE